MNACEHVGAVYADVLCRCVNTKQPSSCFSRCRRVSMTADNDDNFDDDGDVVRMSRRAATTAGAETAAISTMLPASSPSLRPGGVADPRACLVAASRHMMTTVLVAVDNHDHAIEMRRIGGSDGDDAVTL